MKLELTTGTLYVSGSSALASQRPLAHTGAYQIATVYKGTETFMASNTAQSGIPGLSHSIDASTPYIFEALVLSTAGAGGLSLSASGQGTASVYFISDSISGNIASGFGTIVINRQTAGEIGIHLRGAVNTDTAGAFQIYGSQNVSNSAPTSFRVGSYLKMIKIKD